MPLQKNSGKGARMGGACLLKRLFALAYRLGKDPCLTNILPECILTFPYFYYKKVRKLKGIASRTGMGPPGSQNCFLLIMGIDHLSGVGLRKLGF